MRNAVVATMILFLGVSSSGFAHFGYVANEPIGVSYGVVEMLGPWGKAQSRRGEQTAHAERH